MTALLDAYERLLRAIAALEKAVGVFLIAVIVVTITIQVFTRYVFDRPIVWVEEVATYAFIWGAFIGAALGHKTRRHIRIETFVSRLGPRGTAAMRIAAEALILLLCWLLATTAWTVMGVEARSRSIALPVDIPRMWFYSVPLFFGTVSIAIASVYFLLREAQALAKGGGGPDAGGRSIA
ncbi:MAG: TRAP transporter small permease [Alphaproteobacteria bacterium]|nr:TRAP transporter small permease [Alphaproteobacteria bacterium]